MYFFCSNNFCVASWGEWWEWEIGFPSFLSGSENSMKHTGIDTSYLLFPPTCYPTLVRKVETLAFIFPPVSQTVTELGGRCVQSFVWLFFSWLTIARRCHVKSCSNLVCAVSFSQWFTHTQEAWERVAKSGSLESSEDRTNSLAAAFDRSATRYFVLSLSLSLPALSSALVICPSPDHFQEFKTATSAFRMFTVDICLLQW